jgi:hypothetical protein
MALLISPPQTISYHIHIQTRDLHRIKDRSKDTSAAVQPTDKRVFDGSGLKGFEERSLCECGEEGFGDDGIEGW